MQIKRLGFMRRELAIDLGNCIVRVQDLSDVPSLPDGFSPEGKESKLVSN
jgi:hypothetical protein